jgi:serine/threonine protein kinase
MRVDPGKLQPGQRVDGWRVVARLGEGAYGTVYRVEKEGQHFALKLALHSEAREEEEDTDARAQRELSCLLALKHPNIARVYSHGRWPHPREGSFYLVMEYVEGFTLGQWSEAVHPTFHELVVLAEKVAAALAFTHERGIYHRDVKPSNLMVRKGDGEPVLVDYGAASFPVVSQALTDKPLPPGTPRYTSPEAARFAWEHRREAAARYHFQPTDEVYAFGVTLYDVLTEPLLASNPRYPPVSGVVKPPESARELNGRVPVALSQWLDRLLARAPEQRPQSLEAVRRELAEFLSLQEEEWRATIHPPSAQVRPPTPVVSHSDAAGVPHPRLAPAGQRRVAFRHMAAMGGLLMAGVLLALAVWSAARPEQQAPPAPRQAAPM